MTFALVPQGFRFEVITSRLSYDEAKVFLRPRADAGRGAAPAASYAAACADTSSDANTDGTDRCGPQPKVSRPSWAPLVRGDVTTQIGYPPGKPAPYLPFALSTSIVSSLLAER